MSFVAIAQQLPRWIQPVLLRFQRSTLFTPPSPALLGLNPGRVLRNAVRVSEFYMVSREVNLFPVGIVTIQNQDPPNRHQVFGSVP